MKMKFALSGFLSAIFIVALLVVHTTSAQQPPPRRIEVVAKRFDFVPGEITLKKGEPVVLVLKSVDVAHGLRFKELGIAIKADKGHTSELTFTPDKTGDFVGHCSVFCGAGHSEMTLTLHIVE